MTKLVLVALLVVTTLSLARADRYLTENSRPTEYYGADLSLKQTEEAGKVSREKKPQVSTTKKMSNF